MFMWALITVSLGVILMLFYLLIKMLTFKKSKEMEMLSTFECGFMSLEGGRLPFSLHFFMISIIFLIFDVELIFLFPYFMSKKMSQFYEMNLNIWLFLMFIFMTSIFEWSQEGLEWVK